jgi:hypothetical protein
MTMKNSIASAANELRIEVVGRMADQFIRAIKRKLEPAACRFFALYTFDEKQEAFARGFNRACEDKERSAERQAEVYRAHLAAIKNREETLQARIAKLSDDLFEAKADLVDPFRLRRIRLFTAQL